ncbi:MAG: ATP synthase F1 subunit epsilon [Bacteroidales bacterium]|nr:ATP synthase F1 subunit epsilon [Bacteroidales bacterium]RLD38784.1 MAG: ATP synthase F1 subunit epsilon [Bacteroidota bacterium]
MNLQIVTPDSNIFDGEASLIKLPGIDGSFEVLENHAPIISVLKQGELKVIKADKTEALFPIKGGVVEVLNNKVLILIQ